MYKDRIVKRGTDRFGRDHFWRESTEFINTVKEIDGMYYKPMTNWGYDLKDPMDRCYDSLMEAGGKSWQEVARAIEKSFKLLNGMDTYNFYQAGDRIDVLLRKIRKVAKSKGIKLEGFKVIE